MRTNILILIISIALGFGATLFIGQTPPPNSVRNVPVEMSYTTADKGQKIPDIRLTTINGKTIHLDDLLDHKILMNFWASWCAPCIVELPDLLDLAHKNPEMIVILLSSDLTEDALKRHIDKLPAKDVQQSNVIIAWDERGKITRDVFQTFQLPETVFIDAAGRLQHKFVGVIDWGDKDVLKLLNRQ